MMPDIASCHSGLTVIVYVLTTLEPNSCVSPSVINETHKEGSHVRTYVWAVVAGLALAYAIYGIATVDRRTDEQQILSLIDNTARAVENHNFSGAIEAVSKHYKDDSGLTYDRLRVLAAQAMREEITYKVSAKPGPVGILGDSASVQVRVTVTRPNGAFCLRGLWTWIFRKKKPGALC